MPSSPLPPGRIIIHSNLLESLRDVLIAWMRRHPLAPLEQEVILVQSSGIAQWLKLALATTETESAMPGSGAGIAAALELLLPARFLWRVYRAVLGATCVPSTSSFDKSRLVWRLMRLLPQVMTAPLYTPLRQFLENDEGCRKRYQLAQKLADVLDQYQVYRADWLAAWAEGQYILPRQNGAALPLPENQRWQAALWQALCQDIKTHACGDAAATAAFYTPVTDAAAYWMGGRAAVHAAFMQRAAVLAASDSRPLGLPRRVVVFGISTLPRQSLEVLAIVARWTQVLVCVHNPCEYDWSDIIEGKALLRAAHGRQPRRHSHAHASYCAAPQYLDAHPLLAAWGKQGRDC